MWEKKRIKDRKNRDRTTDDMVSLLTFLFWEHVYNKLCFGHYNWKEVASIRLIVLREEKEI